MVTKLNSRQLPYAYWKDSTDPATNMKVSGLGANCYFLFKQPAILNSVEVYALKISDEHTELIRPDRVVVETIAVPEPKGNIMFDGSLQWEDDKTRIQIGDVPAMAAPISGATPTQMPAGRRCWPARFAVPVTYRKNGSGCSNRRYSGGSRTMPGLWPILFPIRNWSASANVNS